MSIKRTQVLLIGGAFSAVILYALLLIYLSWPIDEISINKAGVFGDSFGILTSLFSALAFTGMITAISLQKEELSLQREELAATRKEISAQKEVLMKQSFNDNFYRLLDYYKDNLDQLSVRKTNEQEYTSGVGALKYLLDKFSSSQIEYNKYYDPHQEDKLKVFEHHLFLDIHGILMRQTRYLGTLRSLLSLVESQVKNSEKETYWDIITSQLTVHEVKYIFYNCLTDLDDRFVSLVLKSGILQNRIPFSGIPNSHIFVFQKNHNIYIPKESLKAKKLHSRKEIRAIKRHLRDKENGTASI